ncbi:MAG: hypothetical protein HY815_05945 [Candidatus Riflebacteria bacterium]|nr:hypothetical protein [Candidatus Riflebacteria bacterium]
MDAFPSPVLIVEEDLRVVAYNFAAAPMMAEGTDGVLKRRGGEALHCIRAAETPDGCGRSSACSDCVVRGSVGEALAGRKVVRRRARMELVRGREVAEVYALVTASAFDCDGATYVLLTLEDISELVQLKGLLPICAWCKRVRDDSDYWENVDTYFASRLDLEFSHGICPGCAEKFAPTVHPSRRTSGPGKGR